MYGTLGYAYHFHPLRQVMKPAGLPDVSVASSSGGLDGVYPEYSSQTLRDESLMLPETSPHSDGKYSVHDGEKVRHAGDVDSKRVKLPAIAKSAWTPNSSKRVSFNPLDDEAAKLASSSGIPVLGSPPRPQRGVPAAETVPSLINTKQSSNQSPVDGSRPSQDDDLPGDSLWSSSLCNLNAAETTECFLPADDSNIPTAPIDAATLLRYQLTLKQKFEEVRYTTSIRRPEDVLETAAIWG
jgi:hypothetical protein